MSGWTSFHGRVRVAAPLDEAFWLFSPEGEKVWISDWNPELLDPEWREGQVFRTREESGPAVWIVTRHAPESHRVEYHRVEPERWVARVRVRCTAVAEGATEVAMEYSYFGLTEEGEQDIQAMSEEAYEAKMARWGQWIAAYLDRRGESP
jgi:hypothetical protein